MPADAGDQLADEALGAALTGSGALGASGPLSVRADSGFWSYRTIATLERLDVRYSIGVSQQAHVGEAIAQIPEQSWQPLDGYPPEGIAEIAEGTLRGRRLVVRRTRLLGSSGSCTR